IVSADPARNIMRDSDIAVSSGGRVAVPTSQSRHDVAHDEAAGPPEPLRSEIGVELIPCVSHRREAIAEMPRAARSDDGFDAAMAGADDQIETVEIELLDGHREQRQICPVESRDEW